TTAPSCPAPLSPKQVTLLPLAGELSAHENPSPTAVPTTSDSEAWVGIKCEFLVPSPSWPCWLSPQHHSCLLPSTAQVASPAAAIAVTPCRLSIGDGADWLLLAPLPICPSSLLPQHTTPWSLRIAQVWASPLAIAIASLRFDTATGVWKSLVEPLPS